MKNIAPRENPEIQPIIPEPLTKPEPELPITPETPEPLEPDEPVTEPDEPEVDPEEEEEQGDDYL